MTLTKHKPPRATQADRKRAGQHHRQGHNYIKTYWPYLPMIVVLMTGFVLNARIASQHRTVLGYATDLTASQLVVDTNAQREANHEALLALNTALEQAAQAKANDMATRNYWSHITPDGKTPGTFITASGYNYRTAGENLAYGFATAEAVTAGWMSSTEHRANLLDTGYKDVGFGIVNVANYQNQGPETLVVAMYAAPALPGALPASTATIQPLASNGTVQTIRVNRLQVWVGDIQWGILATVLIGSLGAVFLVVRHGYAWRNRLLRKQQFILNNPMFDIIAIIVVTYSALLAQTAGLIK